MLKNKLLSQSAQKLASRTALVFALLLAVSHAQAQPAAAPAAASRIDGPPLVLDVPLGAEGPIVASATISLTDEMRQLFGADNPIQWAPDVGQAPLQAVLTDEPREVSLGEQEGNQVLISFERGLLLPDQPRTITLTVPKSPQLSAGLYRGSIVSTLSALRSEGVSVSYVWPVTLRVSGRYLIGARFHPDAAGPPAAKAPVGRSAAVSLLVETVNCELGEGLLELRSPSSKSFACLLLPLAGPIDAATTFPTLTHRLLTASDKKAIWPNAWNNHPLVVQQLLVRERALEGDSVKQFEVRAGLPHLSEIGNWTADFHWERGLDGGLMNAHKEQATIQATPGIIVSTPLAIVGETVSIYLLSDSDLGATVPLVAGSTGGGEPQSLLAEQTLLDSRGVGKSCEYRAAFAPPAGGEYSIRIAKEEAGDSKLSAIEPTTFRALFAASGSLARELVLFRGPSPIWPFWQGSASDGGGYECTRLNALQLKVESSQVNQFRDLSADLIAVGRVGEGKSLALEKPEHWRREPRLALPTQPEAADGELDVYSSKTGATPGTPLKSWSAAECPDGRLAFHLKLSIPREPQGPDDEAASAFGERRYAMRLLVRGVGPGGEPVARIVQIPYRTVITNDWAYYRPWAMWLGGALVLGLLGVAVYFLVNRRSVPRVPTSESVSLAPPISNLTLEADSREYDFSDSAAVRAPAGPSAAAKSNNGALAADESSSSAEPAGYDVFGDDSSSGTDNDMFRE